MMNTLEVLTLVLVIFSALSYIDKRQKKEIASEPPKVKDAIFQKNGGHQIIYLITF